MIIKLLVVLFILALYGLLGRLILRLLRIPSTFRSIATFVISGGLVGVITLIMQAVLLAEEQGYLGEESQILSMIFLSLLMAIVVSIVTVKIVIPTQRR